MKAGVPMATPAPVSVAAELRGERLRDAEVGHHHSTAGAFEEDVVGLDVAVDDGERVGGAERVRGLLHDPAGLFYRELPRRRSRAATDSPSTYPMTK